MILRLPREDEEQEFLSAHRATTPEVPRFLHSYYVVVPEFRRQGYATAMLRQAIELANRSLGITRVLVTCDDDNVGSIRTIEKNGGVLEDVVTGPDLVKPKRRYWIDPSGREG